LTVRLIILALLFPASIRAQHLMPGAALGFSFVQATSAVFGDVRLPSAAGRPAGQGVLWQAGCDVRFSEAPRSVVGWIGITAQQRTYTADWPVIFAVEGQAVPGTLRSSIQDEALMLSVRLGVEQRLIGPLLLQLQGGVDVPTSRTLALTEEILSPDGPLFTAGGRVRTEQSTLPSVSPIPFLRLALGVDVSIGTIIMRPTVAAQLALRSSIAGQAALPGAVMGGIAVGFRSTPEPQRMPPPPMPEIAVAAQPDVEPGPLSSIDVVFVDQRTGRMMERANLTTYVLRDCGEGGLDTMNVLDADHVQVRVRTTAEAVSNGVIDVTMGSVVVSTAWRGATDTTLSIPLTARSLAQAGRMIVRARVTDERGRTSAPLAREFAVQTESMQQALRINRGTEVDRCTGVGQHRYFVQGADATTDDVDALRRMGMRPHPKADALKAALGSHQNCILLLN
jgi:hypothetical protein